MTDSEKAQAYVDCAREVWVCNESTSKKMTQTVLEDYEIPEAVSVLMPNLAELLADLQRQSFLLGAVAILRTLESSGRTELVQ